MRKDITNIVNKLAENGGLDFELTKCYELILNYCKETNTRPSKNTYELNNGVLVINGLNIERVELLHKVPFDEKTYYLVGKILKRGELNDCM
jgi:hypothetical protein